MGVGFDRWVEVCGSGLGQGGSAGRGRSQRSWGGMGWEDRNCSGGRRKVSREREAVVGACNLNLKVSKIISELQMKKWRLRGDVSCPVVVRAGAGQGCVSYPQLPWAQDNNLPGSR